MQSEKIASRTKKRKAAYKVPRNMGLSEMALSDIRSDRRVTIITVESGSWQSMVNSVNFFETVAPTPGRYVELADWTKVTANRKGTVAVNINRIVTTLSNIPYIQKLKLNLMSCCRLDQKAMTTTISKKKCPLLTVMHNIEYCAAYPSEIWSHYLSRTFTCQAELKAR